MNVYRDLDNLPKFRNGVATMGSFDGVHEGHRELLRRVMELSREFGGESIVLTFDPHPRYVLGTGDRMQLLTTLDEKLWLLEQAGIDNVIVITFTEELSHLSPQEFIEQGIARLGLRGMVVGYNHRFGYKKEGDYDFLESRECGFEVFRVEQHQVSSSKVSSTIIRQALSRGMLDKAARLLGHPYVVACELQSTGEVVIDRNKLLPPAGCYAARVNGQIGEVTIGAEREVSFSVKPVDGKVIVEFI